MKKGLSIRNTLYSGGLPMTLWYYRVNEKDRREPWDWLSVGPHWHSAGPVRVAVDVCLTIRCHSEWGEYVEQLTGWPLLLLRSMCRGRYRTRQRCQATQTATLQVIIVNCYWGAFSDPQSPTQSPTLKGRHFWNLVASERGRGDFNHWMGLNSLLFSSKNIQRCSVINASEVKCDIILFEVWTDIGRTNKIVCNYNYIALTWIQDCSLRKNQPATYSS